MIYDLPGDATVKVPEDQQALQYREATSVTAYKVWIDEQWHEEVVIK
jgi:hypothetical protein